MPRSRATTNCVPDIAVNGERLFQLWSRFHAALSHRLRSSLSVISNELYHLQAITPADAGTAALRRCHETADFLNSFRPLCQPLKKEWIPLAEVLTDTGISSPPALGWIEGDRATLGWAFRELIQFVSDPAVVAERSGEIISVTIRSTARDYPFDEGESCLLPLIEATFLAHGFTMTVEPGRAAVSCRAYADTQHTYSR